MVNLKIHNLEKEPLLFPGPHLRGPCEVQIARHAGTELSGVRSQQVSGFEGVKSMLKADGGGRGHKIKFSFSTPQGVCPGGCVKGRESLRGAERSLSELQGTVFPPSIQLRRPSVSDLCPFPQNNNEVFCVLTT